CLALSLAVGASPGAYQANAAAKAGVGDWVSGVSDQTQHPTPNTQHPSVLVIRVYFHDNAERDRLAAELGADEEGTQQGFITVWADRDMYNMLLARGLRVEIDDFTTKQANNPHLFGQNGPD